MSTTTQNTTQTPAEKTGLDHLIDALTCARFSDPTLADRCHQVSLNRTRIAHGQPAVPVTTVADPAAYAA